MSLPEDTVANKATCLDNGNMGSLSLPPAPNKPNSALLVTGFYILHDTRATPSPPLPSPPPPPPPRLACSATGRGSS